MFSSREKCTNSATKNGIKETQGKKPWVFFAFMGGDFAGGEERSRDRGKRMKTAYVSEDHWWLKSEENKRIWRKLAENLFGK